MLNISLRLYELPYPLFEIAQSSDSDNKSTSYTALYHSNRNLYTPPFFLAHFYPEVSF